jgi:hypothetical protein
MQHIPKWNAIFFTQISFSETIFFAQPNNDDVIDKIPMDEVKLVREMADVDEESKKSKDANELMIETHPEGYNSGRTYYLQAESKAFCRKVVQQLSQYCKDAHERANAQTVFSQAQQYVGKMYRSAVFQNIVAILIIAVCAHKSFECRKFPFFSNSNATAVSITHARVYSAEFYHLRNGCPIQERRHHSIRSIHCQHQLFFYVVICRGAWPQYVFELVFEIRPKRVELAGLVCCGDVFFRFRTIQHPRLVGAINEGF